MADKIKALALFETTLAEKITTTSTSWALVTGTDKKGTALSGIYGIAIDEGETNEEFVIATITGTAVTGATRGIDVADGKTSVTALKKAHARGASVKITNFPLLGRIMGYINDAEDLPDVLRYADDVVISDPRDLVYKSYADAIATTGITAFSVSDAGGITVDVNSGTYVVNGYVGLYAGVSGETLTDDATNYVQFKDRALDVNTTGFDNDAIPLAEVTCASGDITVLTDKRPFITYMDIKSNVASYMTCGTAGETDYTNWVSGVTDGEFNITIDGTLYTVEGIDCTGDTSMDDVATTIQAAIRAETSGSEVVAYDSDNDVFTITSGTSGSESNVSVLSDPSGTGTYIGGASWMNGETGTGTPTVSDYSGLVRDTNGIYIDLDTDPALKIVDGKLSTKIKSSGGVLRSSDGLYLDDTYDGFDFIDNLLSKYNTYKAGEALTALKYVHELVETESFDTGTDTRTLAASSANQRISQGFQVPVDTPIQKVLIKDLRRNGSPTTDLRVSIYSDDGSGLPDSELIYGTLDVDKITETYSDYYVVFTDYYNLVADTQYHIVIRRTDDSTDGSNYYELESQEIGTYANGVCSLYNGSTTTWANDGSRDIHFEVEYNVVKLADKDNYVGSGNPKGFVIANADQYADVTVQESGKLTGFDLVEYDIDGGENNYFNISSSGTGFNNIPDGTDITQYFYLEDIGWMSYLSVYLNKVGSGNNLTISVQKKNFEGSWENKFSRLYTPTEIGAAGNWVNFRIDSPVDGGGAYRIIIAGSGGGGGNYYQWYRNDTGSTAYPLKESGGDIRDNDNSYLKIYGYDYAYPKNGLVFLGDDGNYTHKPEDESQLIARVINRTIMDINPKFENKLVSKQSVSRITGGSGTYCKYVYASIPLEATRIVVVGTNNAGTPTGGELVFDINGNTNAIIYDVNGASNPTFSVSYARGVIKIKSDGDTSGTIATIYCYK